MPSRVTARWRARPTPSWNTVDSKPPGTARLLGATAFSAPEAVAAAGGAVAAGGGAVGGCVVGGCAAWWQPARRTSARKRGRRIGRRFYSGFKAGRTRAPPPRGRGRRRPAGADSAENLHPSALARTARTVSRDRSRSRLDARTSRRGLAGGRHRRAGCWTRAPWSRSPAPAGKGTSAAVPWTAGPRSRSRRRRGGPGGARRAGRLTSAGGRTRRPASRRPQNRGRPAAAPLDGLGQHRVGQPDQLGDRPHLALELPRERLVAQGRRPRFLLDPVQAQRERARSCRGSPRAAGTRAMNS